MASPMRRRHGPSSRPTLTAFRRLSLTPEQSRALVQLDVPGMVTMGIHPLAAFLANMQVQRERAEKPS